MKKLLLINPVGRKSGYLMSRFSTFSPLGLAYVAAVTPDTWEVKIADENFQAFEFEDADLVAITALRCPPFLNPRKDRRFDTSSY